MTILVIGKNSQLGKEFIKVTRNNVQKFLFADSTDLNLLNRKEISKFINLHKPNIVINFAAYTNVEGAEKETDLCLKMNAEAPLYLSEVTNEISSYLIHISTDYVFGNKGKAPFSPGDKTDPLNFYGKSKLIGENNILSNNPKSLIIRTSALFSFYNNNFVKNMIMRLLKGDDLNVISDQKISLTSAKDLAKFIFKICESELINLIIKKNRIINYTNTGFTNWYEVTTYIKECLNEKALTSSQINPILAKDWKSVAKRPQDSRLNIDYNFFNSINIGLSDWKEQVSAIVIDELNRLNDE